MPVKTFTPSELAALEHAFASDPGSEAYRPLTEAYLSLGRFMEAMVVCKKGVKAHPGDVTPRLLLVRVYAEQGKDRKALEEAGAALQEHGSDPGLNRAAGLLYLKLGEKEAGEAALRRAFEAAPDDAATLEAMKKWGVQPPAGPAPRPARAIPVAPRVTAGAGAAPQPIPLQKVASQPIPLGEAVAPPSARPAPPRRNVAYAEQLAEKYATQEYRLPSGKTGEIPLPRRVRKGPGLKTTLGLVVVLIVALGGWYAYSSWRKARAIEIDRLLKQTRELIEKDSYAAYKQAAKNCEQILDRDPDSLAGHSFLAYVDALRWGEHGEGDAVRDEARKQLELARKQGTHSHAIAADAYLKFFGGDPKGAVEALNAVLKGPEGGTSGLLYGALGVVQMQSGDLDGAKDSLTIARKFADRDVRVNQMLAEQYRRRGAGYELQAITFYEAALRLSNDHVPSLIGVSLMLLARDQLDDGLRRIQKVLDQGDASPRQVALARVVKGSLLYEKGKAAEGASEEQQALALDPGNPDIQDLVGRRRLQGGDVAGAVESFQKAVQMDPQRVAFYVDLAGAMMQRKDGAKQAVEALRNASSRLPGNARIVKLLGDAYRADGDAERARVEYEKALAAEKRFPDARMALARVWRERKDFARALDELEKAAKEYGEGTTGGAAQAYVEMAEIEQQRGGKPEAVDGLYQRAIKADATNCPALWFLGRERADKRSRLFSKDLGKQMLSDYVKLCPRGPHAGEAARLSASLR